MILTLYYFEVGVYCRILYFSFSYLYVSHSGSTTSVGEERANLSAIGYVAFTPTPIPNRFESWSLS